MQTLIIGDIHGCYAELWSLLENAGLSDGDLIVAAGDIVDRGPETPQVVSFFQQSRNALTLMGNHERKHIRSAKGEVALSLSQQISKIQLGDVYPTVLKWLSSLPLYVDLPEAVVVHGYLELGIPLGEQNPMVLCGTMGGEKILHQRYDQPWYALYCGDKPVVVGHKNYTKSSLPFIYQDKVFGLDTDCVHGKALTGLLLPSFRIVSVPSRGNMWLQVRRSVARPVRQPSTPKVMGHWDELNELALARLVETIQHASETLLTKLHENIPAYSDLPLRKQAKLFAAEAGSGAWGALINLARQGKCDPDTARRILKTPAALHELITNIPGDKG